MSTDLKHRPAALAYSSSSTNEYLSPVQKHRKANILKRLAEGHYKDDPHNFNNDKFGLHIPTNTSIVGSKTVLEVKSTKKDQLILLVIMKLIMLISNIFKINQYVEEPEIPILLMNIEGFCIRLFNYAIDLSSNYFI